MILPQDILQFWFQSVSDETIVRRKQPPFSLWFRATKEFDQEIKEKFFDVFQKAKKGELEEWEKTVEGRLALILLFDQFARNLFRGTSQAYETDFQAQDLAQRILVEEQDKELPLIYRVFVYMPLMHAEDVRLQQYSVDCFEQLVEDSKQKCPQNTSYYEWHLKYARQNFETILAEGHFKSRPNA